MTRLTQAKVKSISKPGLHGDGATLYLHVGDNGSKSWIQRLAVAGRRRDIGLGSWPLVTLNEAREAAFENRKMARAGGDPVAAKRRDKAPTFRDAAFRTFEQHRPRWRNAKVASNWMQQLERHAFKRLGDMPVDMIGPADVLAVLTPIWTVKPEAARKVRQRIRATLSWAQSQEYVQQNVAGEAIDGALPTMPAIRSHFRALPYAEIPAALETIEESRSSMAAKLAMRFLILTAARSGEVRGATWGEIDMEAGEWRIPASRMKAGAEHRVPLSEAALDVLREAAPLRDGTGDDSLVFPSPRKRNGELSDMTLTKVLRTTGLAERSTVHGFRSSFRDWCGETGKPREIAEAALAHAVGGVEGAYFRSDLFARRRDLMDAWAHHVTATPARVVRLHG